MLTARSRGSTLLELTLVLLLTGVVLALSVRLVRDFRDRWAVEAARRTTAAAFHLTRAEAVARGGASLRVDTAGAVMLLETGGERRHVASLAREHGVSVRLGSRASRSFRYDPAGIGRVANATLTFRRGRAESRLVVSLFGRVRP